MLLDKLKNNKKIPMHMPGHKRNIKLLGNELPYNLDITEIDGFDNLHNAEGLLKDIEFKLKNIYKSKESFMLVNGSTCGILASINSIVKENDTVLIARNCHKSVYNAVAMARAHVEYISPDYDEFGIAKKIKASDVENIINTNQSIQLIVITSPTYEGVFSDIKGICNVAHQHNIPVIVDAAHGAHLFEKLSEYQCADIVIMSLHKTLPALTQCAVANVYGNLTEINKFKNMLSVFQTSSPSYILMSSIEECTNFILSNNKEFKKYYENLHNLYSMLSNLKNLRLLKYDDIGKLIVFTGYSDISGTELADILRYEYNIEIEMSSENYIIAMTGVCDSRENLESFTNAILSIDSQVNPSEYNKTYIPKLQKKFCEPFENNSNDILSDFKNSSGKVSAEYVFAYPPGIPVLIPGEIITDEVIDFIMHNLETGINIQSTFSYLPHKIMIKNI